MVCVGDSFTEGLCDDEDPVDPTRFTGWADRLAVALAARADGQPFRYANLAVRGRLLADITGDQLDAALALRPDLISIVGGGNDILRPRVDVEALATMVEGAVVKARATGADVLLATPVCPGDAPVIRLTTGRVGVFAAHLNSIARRHGCHLLDQWGLPLLRQARVWAPDRIHLTSAGHRIVTLAALSALGLEEGDPADLQRRYQQLADAAAPHPLGRRADADWARQFAGPWVRRRLRGHSSGDGVEPKRPTLQPL
jgi:lysophospholipase L1-like esterase